MKKNEPIIEMATLDIKNTEMTEESATRILEHLIKHNYTVTEYSNIYDSLTHPKGLYTIKAKRHFTVFPESPRVKMNDLIELFNNAVKALHETGKINIEIDQGVGAIDITAWNPKKDKKEKI